MSAPVVLQATPSDQETDVVLSYFRSSGRPFLDLTDRRFGQLVVIRQMERPSDKPARWECRCDCGRRHDSVTSTLLRGKTTRCQYCASAATGRTKRASEPAFNHIFQEYKNCAKQKGREFDLSTDQFRTLILQVCHYCGAEPSRNIRRCDDQLLCNGIDRMNSKLGYIAENCVPCCTRCNMIKRDVPYVEFVDWITQAATHLKGH